MSTLLTVPFVTSTASVPSKVPPGEGEVKVPEMLKVVMVLAFATPVMSACFMAAVALLSPAAPQHCSLDPVQPGFPVRSAARLLT